MRLKRLLEDRRDWLLTLGVVAIGAGFVAIGLGWFGAARKDTVPQQFPYILSGGLAGLGLLVVGSALVITQSFRRDNDRVHAAIAELGDLLAASEVATLASGARGHAEGLVAVGRSSYHDPECHLVAGRNGEAELITTVEAERQGLEPCRVCNPVTVA